MTSSILPEVITDNMPDIFDTCEKSYEIDDMKVVL